MQFRKPVIPHTAAMHKADAAEAEVEKAVGTLRRMSQPPEQYLPPHRRSTQELGELTMAGVKSFAELPTTQLDNLLEAVRTRLEKIEEKAEAIKSEYKRRTDELTQEINRLNEACVKSEQKMAELHTQLDDLYNGPKPIIPQIEEPS